MQLLISCLSPVFQLSRANQERASIDAMARASIDASSDNRYRTDHLGFKVGWNQVGHLASRHLSMVQDVHRSIIIFNRRGFSSVSIDDTGFASNDCFLFVSTSNGQLG
ncbi:hypothetical protein F2Q68_00006028 [Brassica cretica]|uniref:Uncharacterized protein n=1 Tax=Brassica cretica TaxID=69181 RepID=A0A8S9JD70_BRACR|nr:hypothetical protein F2Q68_00006028 [Brassica cretica]